MNKLALASAIIAAVFSTGIHAQNIDKSPSKKDPAEIVAESFFIQKGLDLYKSGNYTDSFKIFYKYAEKGNPIAQELAGFMLLSGRGTTSNPNEAYVWFNEIDDPSIAVQCKLGEMYYHGVGAPLDYHKARARLTSCAKEGNNKESATAKYLLGRMNYYGKGGKINLEAAKNLFWQSAMQLNEEASEAYSLMMRHYPEIPSF